MSLVAAIEERVAGAKDVVVSRAASPRVKTAVAAVTNVHEAPAVRGRTVWEAAPPGLVCVESPNWWGRHEAEPANRPCFSVDRRSHVVVAGMPTVEDPPDWAERIELLRRCLRTASQHAGIVPAHGDPEAPWAVLLLPIPAERVAAACVQRGVAGVAALAPRVPELPGGVRIAVPLGAGTEWSAAVVASITHEIERTGAA